MDSLHIHLARIVALDLPSVQPHHVTLGEKVPNKPLPHLFYIFFQKIKQLVCHSVHPCTQSLRIQFEHLRCQS